MIRYSFVSVVVTYYPDYISRGAGLIITVDIG